MEPFSKPPSSQEPPSIPPPPTQEDHLQLMPKPAATEKRARRRRREISSRYLSSTPSNSSSSTPIPSSLSFLLSSGDPSFPLLRKHHHQEKHRRDPGVPPSTIADAGDLESQPSSYFADENRPGMTAAAEEKLDLVTPLPLGIQSKAVGTERKRVVRLFGENGVEEHHQQQQKTVKRVKLVDGKLQSGKPRPGTPMVCAGDQGSVGANCTPKQSSLSQNLLRSMNFGAASLKRIVAQGSKAAIATPARGSPFPLEEHSSSLPVETSSESSSTDPSEAELCAASGQGEFCESPRLLGQKNSRIQVELDHLLNMSARQSSEDGGLGRHNPEDSSRRVSSSPFHHSLSLTVSNCQQPPFNPTKSACRPLVLLESLASTARPVALGLPPRPPSSKLGMDLKKGKKALNHQEDIHSLRLLHNCNLQWRFINAKAQAAVNARTIAAEISLYSHEAKLSELRDSVAVKRIELEKLKRERNLQAIVEDQMPYLDQWTGLEGDHSSSLSGAIKVLQDASLRLPVIGDVKADISELVEVLKSVLDILEESSSCVGRFLPQVEGVEDIISDLAMVVSRERALFEEFRYLISMVHELQVKECSLRSHLIQQKQNCVKSGKTSGDT
ncbi:QWRF motif-containing protein 6-like [Phoenix dactylifera]|uniref:QWRF motif-containing protein 6-like n=1 Tax=Phoenix dactylifera TaxID=42345 RepID=A0A8B8ZMS5_PHODC|nr:QWRF motif-containing protein 6-like [Phoenix dactylifera]